MADDEDAADEPEVDLDEILEATAGDRRQDGLKMIGGGLLALALAGAIQYFLGAGGGNVSRILVLIVKFGSLLLGALLTVFGTALVVNSYYMSP